MTLRQIVLKLYYPVLMWGGKIKNNAPIILDNKQKIKPITNFYDLVAIANNGKSFLFDQLKGKKVIVVNTASNCGYTAQYAELEKLYQQQKDKLIIIAFPANDFKNQETADDKAIAEFCQVNYGVTFPLMHKSQVVKGNDQNSVFKWLSDANRNGWCNQQPVWNFSKYIINEEGVLTHFFPNTIAPLSKEFINALQ